MHWGRSRGQGRVDITGWSAFPLSTSPPTPRLRDPFKHSDCASETHHLNSHIAIVMAVAAICGETGVSLDMLNAIYLPFD